MLFLDNKFACVIIFLILPKTKKNEGIEFKMTLACEHTIKSASPGVDTYIELVRAIATFLGLNPIPALAIFDIDPT
jgi:hypothetical protein